MSKNDDDKPRTKLAKAIPNIPIPRELLSDEDRAKLEYEEKKALEMQQLKEQQLASSANFSRFLRYMLYGGLFLAALFGVKFYFGDTIKSFIPNGLSLSLSRQRFERNEDKVERKRSSRRPSVSDDDSFDDSDHRD